MKWGKISLPKCLAALVGIFLISVGVAFNAMTRLGNDPVGIFYDGIRNALGLTQAQLGSASNLVNIVLIILLLIIGKHYINIGTIIYILPYGTFVNIGTFLYSKIFVIDELWCRILGSAVGCVCIYGGVAIFITMDIGLDPMTGLAMVLRDKMKCRYRKAKIIFDVTLTVAGFLLGGKLGVITVITALTGGPVIQFFADRITGIMNIKKKVEG